MNYIFDSSSLIYLGKIELLEKIGRLPGNKFISEEVYREVVEKGVEKNEPEADYINNLIENKIFFVRKNTVTRFSENHLSVADASVLNLAIELNGIAIIDESYARNIAKSSGIERRGSIYVILKMVKNKLINKEEAVFCLNKIIDLGFYLSTTKYKEFLELLEKI